MTRERIESIKAKPHGPDVAALIAEVERLRDRERFLQESCNAELELRREAERQCYVERATTQTMRSHERIETFMDRQWQWSLRTFGSGYRKEQLLAHIRKELLEIEANPTDRIEWIDLILLAADGYSRVAGGDTVSFMPDMLRKQAINFARTWNVPEDPHEAAEHDRTESA